MSHTPQIIRVRETELEYFEGLQGVSSQEKMGKVCLILGEDIRVRLGERRDFACVYLALHVACGLQW